VELVLPSATAAMKQKIKTMQQETQQYPNGTGQVSNSFERRLYCVGVCFFFCGLGGIRFFGPSEAL